MYFHEIRQLVLYLILYIYVYTISWIVEVLGNFVDLFYYSSIILLHLALLTQYNVPGMFLEVLLKFLTRRTYREPYRKTKDSKFFNRDVHAPSGTQLQHVPGTK